MDGLGAVFASMTAYRFGHRPMMENCVEVLKREGFPWQDFMPAFDATWRGVDTSAEAAKTRAGEVQG